jgi:transcriptional accessory protein Tex/SPT6
VLRNTILHGQLHVMVSSVRAYAQVDFHSCRLPQPHVSSLCMLACRNAAGALRIRRSAAGLTNEELDPLDDTRVHPESYKWAIAMCQEALQGSKLANLDDDDQIAVEKAISKPELVEKLDLAVRLHFQTATQFLAPPSADLC